MNGPGVESLTRAAALVREAEQCLERRQPDAAESLLRQIKTDE